MKQFGIGQPVRRVEDRRFITGRGNYLDDISRSRQAYAFMLRSLHAHARIRAVDTTAAASAPVFSNLSRMSAHRAEIACNASRPQCMALLRSPRTDYPFQVRMSRPRSSQNW